MRRDLSAFWSHRDALVAEKGIPGLVEFETNFGNFMGGMSWDEEFLPNVGTELVFLATRPTVAGGAAVPAVRYPQFALLWQVKEPEKVGLSLLVGFQNAVGLANLLRGQEGGKPLMLGSGSYKEVTVHTARFLPPSEGEMEGMSALPVRFNFSPSCAIVDDLFVLGSTTQIVEEVIDARGGSVAAGEGVNSGLWVRGAEAVRLLVENREPLVASTMIKEGFDRAAAERRVDLLLGLARHVAELSLTLDESRASIGVTLRARFALAGE
ncbi:MAG: hypothetical protein ACREID_05650 [Planctomycetota bacterium]